MFITFREETYSSTKHWMPVGAVPSAISTQFYRKMDFEGKLYFIKHLICRELEQDYVGDEPYFTSARLFRFQVIDITDS